MSEPLQDHGHSIAVGIEPGAIIAIFRCHEPRGAKCQRICRRCDVTDSPDDVTCINCGTEVVDEACQVVLFLEDAEPEESYVGPESPYMEYYRSGPIEVEWTGTTYTWTYA